MMMMMMMMMRYTILCLCDFYLLLLLLLLPWRRAPAQVQCNQYHSADSASDAYIYRHRPTCIHCVSKKRTAVTAANKFNKSGVLIKNSWYINDNHKTTLHFTLRSFFLVKSNKIREELYRMETMACITEQ